MVFQLEDAIVLRYHDLACEPNLSNSADGLKDSDELQALRRATQQLLQLKTEKLGWTTEKLGCADRVLPAAPAIAIPMDQTKTEATSITTNWRSLTWPAIVQRTQAALLAAQRAWQRWVFKS